jgi:uncharacterized membrane protein YadS
MAVIPGLLPALVLATCGQYLSAFIGENLMGLPKSPISAIMMAIPLGIRLSLGEVGAIGLKSLPVIVGAVSVALVYATFLCRRMCSTSRLGTPIALGTSIRKLISIGLKPLAAGLVSALLVGGSSATLIAVLY